MVVYLDYEICPTCEHQKTLYGPCWNCEDAETAKTIERNLTFDYEVGSALHRDEE